MSSPRLGELVVRCVDHPNYTGARRARVDCAACRWIYERAGGWLRADAHLRLQVGGPK